MTNDKIIKPGARTSHQCRSGTNKAGTISRQGSSGTSRQIWYFSAPSLSLCTRGRNDWRKDSDPGHQDCLYGEALQESDQGTSRICKDHRAKLERDSHTSSSSFSTKRSGAWLRGRNPLENSSWNTALTDCQGKKLSKRTSFSYLTEYGTRVIQKKV
jgi:hypothetical protein